MDLTIHHLRCFLAVARELHFARAAAGLHLSPSTLSEQVSALERRLGRELFTRTSRSVRLTDAGAELLPLAERSVAAHAEVLSWADDAAARRPLRVGLMVPTAGFQAVMAAATRALPGADWSILQLGFLGCLDALHRGEVDCAFVAEIGDSPAPEMQALPLWDEDCVLVAAADHPLASRTSVRLADLAGETFVAVADQAVSDRWLSALGISPVRTLHTARTFEDVVQMCAAGLGVNIAGASASENYARPGIRYIPIADAPRATTFLYLPPGELPADVDRFARVAAETAHARH